MTPMRDRTAWLQGGAAVCLQPPPQVKRAWRLVLLAPPGVDKTTLSSLLSHALGVCPLATGDVFRATRDHPPVPGSAVAEALEQIERGELVTDETVLALLRERSRCLHCTGGFLLDGFPRTLAQARALDALLREEQVQLDAVLSLEAPAEQLIGRFSGRRVCPRCHATYHLATQRPRASGLCDQCGGALIQRPADHPESVCVRLEAYASATRPVTEYYHRHGVLLTIDASGEPVDILARTLDRLASLGLPG